MQPDPNQPDSLPGNNPEPSIAPSVDQAPNVQPQAGPSEQVVQPTVFQPTVIAPSPDPTTPVSVSPEVVQPTFVQPQTYGNAPTPAAPAPYAAPSYGGAAPVIPSPSVVGDTSAVYGSPSAYSQPTKSRKTLKLVAIVVGVLVLLGVIGGVLLVLLGSKSISYSKSDVVSASTNSYSVKYAKQWTDLSANTSVLSTLKSSLGNSGALVDQKVYGYKYNPQTAQGQTLLLTGDTALGVSDSELQQVLQNSAAKQQFETSFQSLLTAFDGDSRCASTANKKETTNFNADNYLVLVNANIDCNYTAANQTKYGTSGIHESLQIGIKNGNSYIGALVSTKADWAKNSTFYQNTILAGLQPK